MQQCSLSLRSAHFFTAVAFREISSTALRKLLLAIEMHMTVSMWASGDVPTNNRRRFTPAELLYQGIADRWCVPNGSLLEAGGASFVNFVKTEDFGGLSAGTCLLNLGF